MGIEPTSTLWQSVVLTTILQPQDLLKIVEEIWIVEGEDPAISMDRIGFSINTDDYLTIRLTDAPELREILVLGEIISRVFLKYPFLDNVFNCHNFGSLAPIRTEIFWFKARGPTC